MTKGDYESRIRTICLAIITIIAIAGALYWLRPVFVPFALAALLTAILLPIVDFLIRKFKVWRSVALVLTLFLGFLGVFCVGLLVSTSVGQFMSNSSEYEQQLTKLIKNFEESIPLDKIPSWLLPEGAIKSEDSGAVEDLNPDTTAPDEESEIGLPESDAAGVSGLEDGSGSENTFDAFSLVPASTIRSLVRDISSLVISGLKNMAGTTILVMLFTVFLLFGSSTRTGVREGIVGEIERRVQKYIGIKIVLSMVTGSLVFLILRILEVDYAMSFGAFAFVLNFVPNVGSAIATALPIPVVLLSDYTEKYFWNIPLEDWKMVIVILAILLPLSVQLLIGNVIEPKVMGDTLGLHPVVLLMALVFWGVLWGLPGVLLAAPMTAIAKIVFERIEVTRPLAHVMEGRLETLDDM